MSNEPCDLDAVQARRHIDTGLLTATDLLESCIARIKARNPVVNAVVATDYEAARSVAKDMDTNRQKYAHLPLFGLPVLVKDLIDTKDLRTTYGSLCFENHIPASDANIVEKLRAAGAIILGKTNTPEFGAGANTFNKVYGATRNPYDSTLTCGGSSGGSAAALACGMAPLAIGSDFGGSLRIPASFCGIVSLRPTPGRVPSASLAVAHSPLWTEGPMARNVADTALCMTAIEGYSSNDPRSAPIAHSCCVEHIELNTLHVGVSADLGLAHLDDGIRSVFEELMPSILPAFGHTQRFQPDLSDAADVMRVIRTTDIYAMTHSVPEEHLHLLGENVQANLAQADSITLADVALANVRHSNMFRQFHTLYDEFDVLICPATAVSPFPVEHTFPKEMNDQPLEDYFSWYAITWTLSLMGCPIVTVPCGNDHKGMPFGIQIIAARHADAFALSVAEAIEVHLQQVL